MIHKKSKNKKNKDQINSSCYLLFWYLFRDLFIFNYTSFFKIYTMKCGLIGLVVLVTNYYRKNELGKFEFSI